MSEERRAEAEQAASLLAAHEKDAFSVDLESAAGAVDRTEKPRDFDGNDVDDDNDDDDDDDDNDGRSDSGNSIISTASTTTAANSSNNTKHGIGADSSVPATVKAAWLGTYFLFSLALTLYNKYVLVKFHFPWLLTCLHASFASAGTYAMLQSGHFKLSRLGRREHVALVAFSALFTANIAVSNLSLSMVSVPFFQTMRMLSPIFTVVIYRLWYSHTYSAVTYASLVPIIIGAGMTTLGELSFTNAGFILTILGVILATIKTIVTNRFMTGSLKLPLFEFLLRMSPLAAMQALACATATGELAAFGALVRSADFSFSPDFFSLFANGFLAFLLNVASFKANLVSSPLTMTVCGNLKQCLTVGLGIVLFDVRVNVQNGVGMLVTMAGAAIYSKIKLDSKR